jgi:DNA-binding MarR family transcriptional regulator
MIPTLEEQICFALYSASRALTSRYRELLEPLGITYPQYLTLLVLWETGSATVGTLGDRLHLDSGTLSPLLRRLEQAGLVTRSRQADDERVVHVSLTRAGTDLRSRAATVPEAICASTGLALDELGALRDQVARVGESVRASL